MHRKRSWLRRLFCKHYFVPAGRSWACVHCPASRKYRHLDIPELARQRRELPVMIPLETDRSRMYAELDDARRMTALHSSIAGLKRLGE